MLKMLLLLTLVCFSQLHAQDQFEIERVSLLSSNQTNITLSFSGVEEAYEKQWLETEIVLDPLTYEGECIAGAKITLISTCPGGSSKTPYVAEVLLRRTSNKFACQFENSQLLQIVVKSKNTSGQFQECQQVLKAEILRKFGEKPELLLEAKTKRPMFTFKVIQSARIRRESPFLDESILPPMDR